jgi:hypothetical protein
MEEDSLRNTTMRAASAVACSLWAPIIPLPGAAAEGVNVNSDRSVAGGAAVDSEDHLVPGTKAKASEGS